MIRKLYVTSVAIDDPRMPDVVEAARAAGAGEIIHLPAPWLADLGIVAEGPHEIVAPDPPPARGLDDLFVELASLKARIEAKLAEA